MGLLCNKPEFTEQNLSSVRLQQPERRRECWWMSDLCDLPVALNPLPSSPAFTSVVCLNKPPPRLCQSAPGDYGFDYISWAPRSAPLPPKEPASPGWWMALLIVSNWLLWKTLLWNTANLVTPIHCSALLILSHLAQALCNWRELHLCICGPTGSKDYWCKGMPVYKSRNTLIFIHCSVSEPPVHSSPPCFNDLNLLTNAILITCCDEWRENTLAVAFKFQAGQKINLKRLRSCLLIGPLMLRTWGAWTLAPVWWRTASPALAPSSICRFPFYIWVICQMQQALSMLPLCNQVAKRPKSWICIDIPATSICCITALQLQCLYYHLWWVLIG